MGRSFGFLSVSCYGAALPLVATKSQIWTLHKSFPQRTTTGRLPVFLMIVIDSNAFKMGGILWRT
jgi:hypothetical protein